MKANKIKQEKDGKLLRHLKTNVVRYALNPRKKLMKTKCVFKPLKDFLKFNEQFIKVMERLEDRRIQMWFHCSSCYGGKEIFQARNHPHHIMNV